MNHHTFYPTVTPRRVRLARFFKCLVVGMLLTVMLVGAVRAIAFLWTYDAQMDSAFMQGMTAGNQLCRGGV